MFGLTPDNIRKIKEALSQFPAIEKVILYGSRAKGNYKDGSDIDITLLGNNLSLKTIYALETALEDLYLPYTFDISLFTQIDNPDLIQHILEIGKALYVKEDSQLPKGWGVKKLVEVCDKARNIKWEDTDKELKYIDLSSVSRDLFSITKYEIINKDNAPSRAKKMILEDDVIFATTRPTLKRVTIVDKLFSNQICSTGFAVLRHSKEKAIPHWIFYFIQSDIFMNRMQELQRGASYPAVTESDVKNTPIPVPPLPEQKRIVAKLNKAFAAIDQAQSNAQRNLENAKELFESYLQGVFENKDDDWEEKKVVDLCDSIIDCINKTAPSCDYVTGFKMIRTSNIRHGKLNLNNVKYVTEDVYSQWTRRQVPQWGDILFTREAPMGEVAMLLSKDKVFLGQRIVSYRFNELIANNNFMLYAFQSTSLKKQVLELGSGATVKHLRVPHTKEFKFYIPKIEEQKQIVQKLDTLSVETKKLEAIYQQKVDDLDELKKSILEKAFKGEL